ncbi:RNA-directed DNA polymerase, eukaryota, partial [Tanacetum coccineum]
MRLKIPHCQSFLLTQPVEEVVVEEDSNSTFLNLDWQEICSSRCNRVFSFPSSDVATRWVKFIPIKVNVFSWRARRDRLPTRVNLSRRGVLLDSHLCPLCNAAMEDVQHVFFRCDVARVVIRKICR